MKRNYIFLFISILFILSFSSCSSICIRENNINSEDAIVSVNGYHILSSNVEAVYEESKNSGITYDKIVEDSILEILVVQKSKEYGIELSKKELDEIMSDFRSEQEEYFSEAINRYGEENLREKLRIRNLFSRTKDYVLSNLILKDGITHEDIEKFKSKYHLEEQLSPYSDAQIIHDLQLELENFLFREWMISLKDEAEIIYLK